MGEVTLPQTKPKPDGTVETIPGKEIVVHVLEEPFFPEMHGTIGGCHVDAWSEKANPYPFDFDPTFHRYRLDIPERWMRARTIFVCSMADLFGEWVPDEWIREVIAACEAAPQHRYLFLTKNPKRYMELIAKDILPLKDNYWYGSTTARAGDPAFYCRGNVITGRKPCKTFLSIEPILERFGKGGEDGTVVLTDWVIVGAETGKRKGKVIPKRDWIMELAEECSKRGKPIFMKESLREIMGADFVQEFPWEIK
jgi:protein gp37